MINKIYEDSTVFDAVRVSEIFNLAMDFEAEAVSFYNASAGMTDDPLIRDTFRKLAGMESGHHDKFASLAKQAWNSGETVEGGDQSIRSYLGSIVWARRRKASFSRTDAEDLISSGNAGRVLQYSIDLEKEAILMYIGLEGMLVNQKSREAVNSIISEEMSHIVILSDILGELRRT